ncbi:uncharacterized protein LOC113225215 isoform X1 [Piliocolobus tephrosceles]|uniref:uncharacterized protein LOC113225215 isoform X1 n=1 Tax=Piliocolobus tephrosceles TaxID=591936 RepID=UPI000E6B23DD|nr:uncharacterized protein LOC113225215 isoform X1 [Piliocolobus tephrosceles]
MWQALGGGAVSFLSQAEAAPRAGVSTPGVPLRPSLGLHGDIAGSASCQSGATPYVRLRDGLPRSCIHPHHPPQPSALHQAGPDVALPGPSPIQFPALHCAGKSVVAGGQACPPRLVVILLLPETLSTGLGSSAVPPGLAAQGRDEEGLLQRSPRRETAAQPGPCGTWSQTSWDPESIPTSSLLRAAQPQVSEPAAATKGALRVCGALCCDAWLSPRPRDQSAVGSVCMEIEA